MFIKFYTLDWWYLLTHFLWILGAAIVLATFSYYEFLARREKKRFREYLKRGPFKKFILAGFMMIGIAIFLAPYRYREQSLSDRFIFIDYNVYDLESIDREELIDQLVIPADDTVMSRKYKVRKNLVIMNRNGYVETPFFEIKKGHYEVEFEAYGSETRGEFSKVIVAFLALEKKGLVVHDALKIIELSDKREIYRVIFEAKKDVAGKFRIQFFNSRVDDKRKRRGIWMGQIEIRRM